VSFKGDGQECGGVFVPTRPRASGPSHRVLGYDVNSIPRDHYLQHEESFNLDSWDLEVPLLPG
jgi:hypothetical protein